MGGPRRRATGWRSRRRWAVVLAVLFVALSLDLSRAPERQWTAGAMIAGIHLYRQTLSPWMPALGARCRFEPSCSRYAEAVIRRYGALSGTARSVGRLARCGPWTAAGTPDPPP